MKMILRRAGRYLWAVHNIFPQIETKANAQAAVLRKKFSVLAGAAHKKIEAAKHKLREQQAVLDNKDSSRKEVK
jgi:hypothetical protein